MKEQLRRERVAYYLHATGELDIDECLAMAAIISAEEQMRALLKKDGDNEG